ncbi:MAG: hypothetical protein QOK40_1007 [Miltoncostaeaceae bacterium]|jgi:hypothetical protein|nr:hypothetical protein [Miltoncostaeaceae bacterium]
MDLRDEIGRLVGDKNARHKRLVQYVVRQIHAGRRLASVLEDPYVTNRATTLERRALLEEPEVVMAGGQEIEVLRGQLEQALRPG